MKKLVEILALEIFNETGDNIAEYEIALTSDNAIIYRELLNAYDTTEWDYLDKATTATFAECAKQVADRLLKTTNGDTYSFAE